MPMTSSRPFRVVWTTGALRTANWPLFTWARPGALRALFYFELVRWYGNVVLMTSTADSRRKDETFEQTAAKDVYAYIEEDLKYAAEVLPWAVDDTRRTTNAYRFSKGAALGLLAKVYCTWAGYPVRDESKWAEAEKAAAASWSRASTV